MLKPPRPADDRERVKALHSLNILGTAREERYDRVIRRLKDRFEVPIAYLALIDSETQWLKAAAGELACELPRDSSFCSVTILEDLPLVISDARSDPDFADHPLVVGEPHVRFYAGVPLSVTGHNVGTLCIADRKPRQLAASDLADLQAYAREVQRLISEVPKVFISYNRRDEKWKNRLKAQLSVLEQQDLLSLWEDGKLAAGDEWQREIADAMEGSNVAVLLVSASFLTSRFIMDVEVPELLKRREREGLRIVPLVIKPCCWKNIPWLAQLDLRPKDGRPLSGMSDFKVEESLAALGDEILELTCSGPGPTSPMTQAVREAGPGAAPPAEPRAEPPLPPPATPAAADRGPVPSGPSSAVTVSRPQAQPETTSSVSPGSLIVAPFADLSPEQDQEYFCDGMAEELTIALSGIEGLRLASRSSAVQLKQSQEDARAIGARFGVEAILEGSVRKSANRIRVTVQLTQVADGFQLWSGRFDRELEDIFDIQEGIAESVAESLRVHVGPTPQATEEGRDFDDVETYNLYLRGRHHWNQRTEESLKNSLECFREAAERSPDCARAHAALASVYATLGLYGVERPEEVMPRARAEADRAVALDPELSEALSARGCVESVFDWDWEAGRRSFEKAIAADPESPSAHHWFAINHLVPLGEFDEAKRILDRAAELDPLSPAIGTSIGMLHYFANRFEAAEAALRRLLEAYPEFSFGRFFLGQTQIERGRFDEAMREMERARESTGSSPEMVAMLAYARARSGDPCGTQPVLRELSDLSKKRYVSPSLCGIVLLGMGDHESALDRLEEALALRAADLAWLGVRPIFGELRSEPRFQAMLAELKLAPGSGAT